MTTVHSFAQLEQLLPRDATLRLVVAGVTNQATLDAVTQAESQGLVRPVLVGEDQQIHTALQQFSPDTGAVTLSLNSEDEADIATAAVLIIAQGRGDILMKGSISSSALLKAVLDKEHGIRRSTLLSDSFLFEFGSGTTQRLVNITDGGIVLYPDVDQKQAILENAVEVAHALGIDEPRVVVCAAIEKINEKMPPTLDAAELTRRYRGGDIPGCIVDGPLALDAALSPEAVRIKNLDSPVNGLADILVMPDIEAANLVAKSTQYVAGKDAAHVIMGATVPVLIPSRSDTPRGKYLSICLACFIRHRN